MPTKAQAFTASGTFTVPANVEVVKATMVGTGGTGLSDFFDGATTGGGSGASCVSFPLFVTPGEVLTITIGATATPGNRHFGNVIDNPNPPVCAPTVCRNLSVDGGKSGYWDDSAHFKSGGGGFPATPNAFHPNDLGGGGAWSPHDESDYPDNLSSNFGVGFFPGSCGGNSGNFAAASLYGGDGAGHRGGTPGQINSPSDHSGGGASCAFGAGGDGGNGNNDGQAGQGYGAGGGGGGRGSTGHSGGRGATGYVLLEWMAP